MALNVIRQEDAADLSGGASVFWNLSAVDLSGRIRPQAYGTEKFMDYGFMEA